MATAKPTSDPFPHLPRRNLFAGRAETKPRETKPPAETKPLRLDAAKATLVEAGDRSKGGRPKKHVDKPWDAEGVSKASWYRRQAEKRK